MAAELRPVERIPVEIWIEILNSVPSNQWCAMRLVCNKFRCAADYLIQHQWMIFSEHPKISNFGIKDKMIRLHQELFMQKEEYISTVDYFSLFQRLQGEIRRTFPNSLRAHPLDLSYPDRFCEQYYKDLALMKLWNQFVRIIDPLPHKLQILPVLNTAEEVREWILDENNAPLLTCVESIFLEAAEIYFLPDEIGLFTQLRALYLSRNQLTCLPESMTQLKSLEHLDLRNNRFAIFPECVQRIAPNLRCQFDGNPLKI